MDNTIIRDLFAKDINRSINGVVKVRGFKRWVHPPRA